MPKTLAASFTLACLLLLSFSVRADVFRFTGQSDTDFTNPANWSPAFPGIIIDAHDVVILESDAVFEGPLLLVHGTMRVEHGVRFTGLETHIQLVPGASLDLRGTVEGYSLISQGTLMLQSWASMKLEELDMAEGSRSMILSMSSLSITNETNLEGRLDVMGSMAVGGVFHNHGELMVMSGAELVADGGMSMGMEQELFYHPQADIRIGSNEGKLASSTDSE